MVVKMDGRFDESTLDGYFKWLIGWLMLEDEEVDAYIDLLEQLFCMEFRYVLNKDVNRIYDGLDLRKEYCEEFGVELDKSYPCSVFEVLLGLSRRLAKSVLGDFDDEKLTSRWFFTWLHNLGLLKFAGNRLNRPAVFTIVEVWMHRDFDYSGLGSPFPLKRPEIDQRKIEIWQQMMLYLAENDVG